MQFITETAVISEVAGIIKSWGIPNVYGVRAAGSTRGYYETLNRQGKFKLADGRRVVLDDAAWQSRCAREAPAGEYDHSLTFLQRATYIQTGECPALLP